MATTISPPLDVDLQKHEWGNLLVVSKGDSWSAIFHPDQLERTQSLKSGETYRFVDEQHEFWKVDCIDEGTYLITNEYYTSKNGLFKLPIE